MKEKLKSCPFCKSDSVGLKFQLPINVMAAFVVCYKCGARGGRATHNCLDATKDDTLESKAIEFWNRRPK